MIKTTSFLLSTLSLIFFFVVGNVSAEEFALPEFHADVALQIETFTGGDSTYVTAISREAITTPVIRHVTLGAKGGFGENIEYNMEVGIASCMGGGFMLMEAAVMYKPFPFLKAGIYKGHIMRGFEMYEECVDVLTSEKPVFALKFSPCHPIGTMLETNYDIDETMGLHAQFGYLAGTGQTLEDEHDINLGLQFRTPVQGLSIGGFYNDVQWHVDEFNTYVDTITMQPVTERIRHVYNGHRMGFGYNLDEFNVHLRGEYYLGKGFKDRVDTTLSFEDMEMDAFFIEGGYSFDIGYKQLSYIQPYIQYQWWNQAANLDGEFDMSLVTVGSNFGIGANDHTRLRIEYQTCLTFPVKSVLVTYSEEQQADRLMVRFQAGI